MPQVITPKFSQQLIYFFYSSPASTYLDLTGVGTERSSSRLLASSNCTVVFGGVGRGMEGSVAKGWEGMNPPDPR